MQEDIDKGFMFGMIIMFVMIVAVIVLNISSAKHHADLIDIAESKIDDGYECYIDGELVDGDNVILSNFIIEIDDEDNKILLSKKVYSKRSYTGVPIIIR